MGNCWATGAQRLRLAGRSNGAKLVLPPSVHPCQRGALLLCGASTILLLPPRRMQHVPHWLQLVSTSSYLPAYRHRRFYADSPTAEVLEELRAFARHAHQDAVREFNELLDPTLAPFASAAPAEVCGYPYKLHTATLQGYFGEILAAILVQSSSPFEVNGWEVPAFRFRVHVPLVYRTLEVHRFTGGQIPQSFGPPGDDCTAFRLDENGKIAAYLICEAKCTTGHDKRLIEDAHKQASKHAPTALDIPLLLKVLERAPAHIRDRWVNPLREFYHSVDASSRGNLVLYVHGTGARNGEDRLPSDKPHEAYNGSVVPLEAVEVHLSAVADVVSGIYAETPPWL